MQHNKPKPTRHMLAFIFLAAIMVVPAQAQFRVISADDSQPIAGAYVFDASGKLLSQSTSEGLVEKISGMVSVSAMGYESQKVDATTFCGDLTLKSKTFVLPEVNITKAEYTKLTTAFRDIFRSNGKTVLYREGYADYYVNMKNKKTTRRIRCCRQYEKPGLRKMSTFSTTIFDVNSVNLSKVNSLKAGSVSKVSGDSTFVSTSYHGRSSDKAVIYIDMHRDDIFRQIIDDTKLSKTEHNILGMKLSMKKNILDWTMSDKSSTIQSLLAFRNIKDYIWSFSSKDTAQVEVVQDVVMTDCISISKKEAQAEMKDKDVATDFTLPESLPDIPYDIPTETEGLKQTAFWER